MGDGVLVYFGYPEAHEDNAERTVRAALQTRVGIAYPKRAATLLQSKDCYLGSCDFGWPQNFCETFCNGDLLCPID
jgi:hypothetical protein